MKAGDANSANTEDNGRSIGPPAIRGTGLSKTAQKILRRQKQPAAPTLFLGNLGFETTEKSIRELFEAHRPLKKIEGPGCSAERVDSKVADKWIRKIRMGTFEDSGNCKG